jgi:chromatin segregation and condensation protein Rec8/ScpA/Scc1 (kleisin family)
MPRLDLEIPKKKLDVSVLMGHLWEKISYVLTSKKKVFFNDLVPSNEGKDKVITFIPLLHLTNQRRIDLEQNEHFGPIEILMRNAELDDEIEAELNG